MRHFFLTLGLLPITLLACGGATSDGNGGNNSPSTVGGSAGEGTAGSGGSGSSSAPPKPGAAGTGGQVIAAGGGYAQGGYGGGGYAGSYGHAGTGYAGAGGYGVGGEYGGAGGVSWGGEGGVACCLAMATCNFGDVEIAGPNACPPGAACYSNSICCSTVWCQRAAAVDGGSAIACNPETEPDRSYVGNSPNECMLIDFACPANTEYFGNDCGCGCEQDAACPDYVNCMPGGAVDPACSAAELAKCPYTLVAY